MARRRKKRSTFEKVILFILFLILAVLLFYAFKDNFINEEDPKIINKENKNNKNENTKKEDKNEKQEEAKSTSKINNSEPKKNEQDETKQEIQNNVSVNIELIGNEEIVLNQGEKYIEPGIKAKDSNGNDVSNKVYIESNVDTSKKGEYMVIYSIGKATVIRNVTVK